jgi:hypothetical protein
MKFALLVYQTADCRTPVAAFHVRTGRHTQDRVQKTTTRGEEILSSGVLFAGSGARRKSANSIFSTTGN